MSDPWAEIRQLRDELVGEQRKIVALIDRRQKKLAELTESIASIDHTLRIAAARGMAPKPDADELGEGPEAEEADAPDPAAAPLDSGEPDTSENVGGPSAASAVRQVVADLTGPFKSEDVTARLAAMGIVSSPNSVQTEIGRLVNKGTLKRVCEKRGKIPAVYAPVTWQPAESGQLTTTDPTES